MTEQEHLNKCCVKWRALERALHGMPAGQKTKAAEDAEYRARRKLANAADSLIKLMENEQLHGPRSRPN